MRAVSARATNDVWAVGPAFTGEANSIRALSIHWDGASWSSAPVTGVDSPDLWAVSAKAGTTRTWTVGAQPPGTPLILERH